MNPKEDAQKTEETGLMSAPPGAQSVAIPDSRVATAREAADEVNAEPVPAPATDAPRPPSPSLIEKLDLERADGEGMAPPSAP